MPRTKSYAHDDLVSKAMQRFWRYGYEATSIDDLVRATGVSRHGIYKDAGGKLALFTACLDFYVREVVTPAFARVEQPDATLDEIASYFERQIALAELTGLPGPGCLMANAMTEIAPRERSVMAAVARHNDRLRQGFARAIAASTDRSPADRDDGARGRLDALSLALVVFANGLWSMSRAIEDAGVLRGAVATMLGLVRERMTA